MLYFCGTEGLAREKYFQSHFTGVKKCRTSCEPQNTPVAKTVNTGSGISFSNPTGDPLVDPLCARPQELVVVSVHVDKGISTVTEWAQYGVDIYHMYQRYFAKQLAKGTVSSSSFRGSCVAVY